VSVEVRYLHTVVVMMARLYRYILSSMREYKLSINPSMSSCCSFICSAFCTHNENELVPTPWPFKARMLNVVRNPCGLKSPSGMSWKKIIYNNFFVFDEGSSGRHWCCSNYYINLENCFDFCRELKNDNKRGCGFSGFS